MYWREKGGAKNCNVYHFHPNTSPLKRANLEVKTIIHFSAFSAKDRRINIHTSFKGWRNLMYSSTFKINPHTLGANHSANSTASDFSALYNGSTWKSLYQCTLNNNFHLHTYTARTTMTTLRAVWLLFSTIQHGHSINFLCNITYLGRDGVNPSVGSRSSSTKHAISMRVLFLA